MLEVEHVVEEIRARRAATRSQLTVYWVTVVGDRDAFASRVREVARHEGIVACVVRGRGFDDPNAVMQDVEFVIEEHREAFVSVAEADGSRPEGIVDVLLIARSELRLAITASPIAIPEWFPVHAGETINAQIVDLTWTTATSLAASECRTEELSQLLYEVDAVLLARLERSFRDNPNRVNSVIDRIRLPKEDGVEAQELLNRMRVAREGVENPASFRPSTVRSPTLVGRIWWLANTTAPDSLQPLAKALARATAATREDAEKSRESLAFVLARPSNMPESPEVRWALGLVATVRTACQLLTASAHADAYPRFSVTLLRSTSLDLREALNSVASIGA